MQECDKEIMIRLNENLTGTFHYVDCGARGDASQEITKIFSDVRYSGFEPDSTECKKLEQAAPKGHSFYPVAIGQRNETSKLFVTRNPGCSSLYPPNTAFFEPFMECGPFFEVLETQQIQVVSLDEYFPTKGVMDIDFLELDTQGAELDILLGAEKFLTSDLLGVKVEIEFAEMYKNQPMFADVDGCLRRHNFTLFDLERYHLRRKFSPSGIDAREQIVWGQALYLRDYRSLPGGSLLKQKLSKLIVIASFYGFHGYALEIIEHLLRDAGLLTAVEMKELENSRDKYLSGLKNSRIMAWMMFIDRSPFHRAFRGLGRILLKLYEAYRLVTNKQKYFWKD